MNTATRPHLELKLSCLVFACIVLVPASQGIAQSAPTVTTEAVTSLTPVSVTLNGTVNPNGAVTTPVFVVNGVGHAATPSSIPAGTDPVAISLNFSIAPGQSYSVYASATNEQGANVGGTVNFSAPVPAINWDPGTTHAGTEVVSSASVPGGQTGPDFYFKITTQNTSVNAWRTALNVTSGNADLYLRQGSVPSTSSGGYDYKSDRSGSDGLVVQSPAANQEWHILVHATAGAVWNLVSGEAYVQNLGVLAADGSSGSGAVQVGAEGVRFFRTTAPPNAKAWRLWLNGANNNILVRKSSLPYPNSGADFEQPRQLLLVPPYFTTSDVYFLAVWDNPGTAVNLDSRIQPVTELAFGGTASESVTGYGYQTYHVTVPLEQIAWEVETTATSGNPNISIRRDNVPNELNNDAFSEATGSATDSVTLSPPTLSDGSFYITVYGSGSYQFTLRNGNPVITDINFTSTTVNDQPTKAGWRFYRLFDIEQQLGSLGWDLFLTNQPPGTELALRRNAVPSRWHYRSGGTGINFAAGHVDYSGPLGFIQRPGHQADIWYIGVYQPDEPLGAFTLHSGPLTAAMTGFDGTAIARTNIPEGKWDYFRIDVPAGAQGWDLRVTDVTGGNPYLVVRRDLLPEPTYYGYYIPSPSWGYPPYYWPLFPGVWNTGYQWPADREWTGWTSASGVNESQRILQMGMGRPLQSGTYYLGVRSDSGTTSYTLRSRGIGAGSTIPVTSLNYLGGTANITGLAPREVAYYMVTIPENTPSWLLRLTPTTGEAMLCVLKDALPNVGAIQDTDADSTIWGGLKMQKTGKEHYVLLPPSGQDFIAAGAYYVAVISEGVDPNAGGNGRIGTGNVDAILQSVGPLPVTNLGTLAAAGAITHAATLESAGMQAYQFSVGAGVGAFEVRLEDRVGNPVGVLVAGTRLPAGNLGSYGLDGGEGGTGFGASSSTPVTLMNVSPGIYSVMLRARQLDNGSFVDSSCTLRVVSLPQPDVTFDGGAFVVTGQEPGTWRFFKVTVPADALGWDLRVTNVGGGRPQMVVQRDTMPEAVATQPYFGYPYSYPWYSGGTWQSGYSYAASADWTNWNNSASGESEYGRSMAMGMNQPLVPGTYYVGIYNDSYYNNANASYTLLSRGIGGSYSVPVQLLPFNGTPANITGLAPREAAYFAVTVPANTPSWQVKLTPTAGEAMMCVAKDALPAVFAQPNYEAGLHQGGVMMKKTGKEHYTMLPEGGQDFIEAGVYYIAVASEGGAPDPVYGRIGTGNINATLSNSSPLNITNLGTVSDTLQILHIGEAIEGGDVKAYDFTVAAGLERLEIKFENRVGEPGLVFAPNSQFPNLSTNYGIDGGQASASGSVSGDSTQTYYNPAAGTYRVLIQAQQSWPPYLLNHPDASFDLRITGIAPPPPVPITDINFESSTNVTGHSANAWRYFRVTVPSSPLGWDVRLINVTGADMRLTVKRGSPPTGQGTTPYWNLLSWPDGLQFSPEYDLTQLPYSNSGANENGRGFTVAMGRPLEPGEYYIGVYGAGGDYTLVSRGIGSGQAIPVQSLTFEGGSTAVSNLQPREAAYYQVTVPPNTASWRLKLTPTTGETLLCLAKDYVPTGVYNLTRLQRQGTEYFTMLPLNGEDFISPGTYFVAVVSEGVGPNTGGSGWLGSGTSSAMLESSTPLPTTSLGTLNPGGQLLQPDTIPAGDWKGYEFNVAAGVSVLELRLLNAVGGPNMSLAPGARWPTVYGYGVSGGQSQIGGGNLIIVNSPVSGPWRLTIGSDTTVNSGYTVSIRSVPYVELNFSQTQNGNGYSHTHAHQSFDGEKVFYRVEIPGTFNGEPVLGWKLGLDITQGNATLYAHHTLTQVESHGASRSGTGEMILVPPYLTPGTWYLEVVASGITDYTITSAPVLLHRPAWVMPADGQPHTTPGLPPGSTFGDTGFDSGGGELPGDHGTDLAKGDWHFYAITVPQGNAGLLRTMLEAISGNPDLYIRVGDLPTISTGNVYDHALSAGSATEYGNWVPANGRKETQLAPGTWYLGVYAAGNSNVRYRLRCSTGNVQTLALNGGSLANQVLAAGDWRYYRLAVPEDAPVQWTPTFSQQVGDVVMFIRDTVPPGGEGWWHWASDNKNQGPYTTYDASGSYPQTTPPLRPGHTYYLGFRANSDATFSVSSATSGGTVGIPPAIAFADGSVTTEVPGGGSLLYRVVVPEDAVRFKFNSVQDGSISIRIEQGSIPGLAGSQHYVTSSGADIYFPNYSGYPNYDPWPWVGGQTYYLRLVNTSANPSPIVFTMAGRTLLNDDGDNDGLLDAWENQRFGHTGFGPTSDPDGDGLENLLEFAFGLNPTLGTSLQLPQAQRIGGNFVISFTQPDGVGVITYGAEWSTTLSDNPADWTPVADSDPSPTGYTFSVPVGANDRMFMRLTATVP